MRQFTEAGEKDFRPDPESLQYIQLQPAVDSCSASFSQLFSAHYGAYYAGDSQEARTWHSYYKRLIPAFVHENGRIVEQFHARFPASAYLTDRDGRYQLFVNFWPDYLAFDSFAAQALLGGITDLRDEAMQYLRPVKQLRLVMQKLFAIACALIAALASEWERHQAGEPGAAAPTEAFTRETRLLEARLEGARKFYVDLARKSAEIYYFSGRSALSR
jgi:hypothetical protein